MKVFNLVGRLNKHERHRIDPVTILGIRYDNLSREEVLDCMESFAQQGSTRMICTPNADHLLQARRDREFRDILERADLVVSDGMGVVYAARLLGTPFKENVGGRLLLPDFSSRAARFGYRLFLLGGNNEEMVQLAVTKLCRSYPGLVIAGSYTPPFMQEFDEAETGRMLDSIHRARPDVLFVCLGTPKQEKWIARNLDRLNVPVSIGIGAALDMIAGCVNEPPRWVSRIGLEWLVKLLHEPKRLWRRYFWNGTVFVSLILKQRFDLKRSQDSL